MTSPPLHMPSRHEARPGRPGGWTRRPYAEYAINRYIRIER
ncbi:hypothetical protein GLA29479_677 [Lysobacter antibioticus]|uniref:Uncharacterized protein n=1 Tax=Lysobacter antibioticus TaxID=84531 RepID=A0A0S2F859_LYSAN|nr:hypothetical protein GLA29479_677 [Lysobacter antibioticus]ALN79753.1 hypothetical protein LA76x_1597 [Lysobacter antibioticus]